MRSFLLHWEEWLGICFGWSLVLGQIWVYALLLIDLFIIIFFNFFLAFNYRHCPIAVERSGCCLGMAPGSEPQSLSLLSGTVALETVTWGCWKHFHNTLRCCHITWDLEMYGKRELLFSKLPFVWTLVLLWKSTHVQILQGGLNYNLV